METVKFDLEKHTLREVNQYLHSDASVLDGKAVTIDNPNGSHNIAVGLKADVNVTIQGHAGYYAAGMNQLANVVIEGSAGTGVAENMMSGRVHVKGFASNAAGATANGGLLIIDGDAGLRCGISMKGANIVVGGSVGSFSAFMAQAGNLVILGDAGEALGDSLYEARIFVRGNIQSLGSDCEVKPMDDTAKQILVDLLAESGHGDVDPDSFTLLGSARKLYNFHVDNAGDY
ncbi:protein glxC [Methylobacillus glycogenes]|uniref:GltB/FmdC/FwdC-like GXGXG domain-containing protein n=1 Tax=Methylobacillus glycogenes TaxID=406 RepID=UPI00046F5D7A|nr:protein glxC [Methylobacillus glycogenes]